MTAVTITKYKPGYAYGYTPSNGSTEIRDFNADISHVTEPTNVLGIMRGGSKYRGDMAREFEANLNNKTYGNR